MIVAVSSEDTRKFGQLFLLGNLATVHLLFHLGKLDQVDPNRYLKTSGYSLRYFDDQGCWGIATKFQYKLRSFLFGAELNISKCSHGTLLETQ
jgi:hypothetical protein